MSSLKPLLLLIVLAGVSYGVYVAINKNPTPDFPPTAGTEWAKPPEVELGRPGGSVAAPIGGPAPNNAPSKYSPLSPPVAMVGPDANAIPTGSTNAKAQGEMPAAPSVA